MKFLIILLSLGLLFTSCKEEEGMLERKSSSLLESPDKPILDSNENDDPNKQPDPEIVVVPPADEPKVQEEDEEEQPQEEEPEYVLNNGVDQFFIFNKNYLSCNPLGNPNVENKVVAEVRVLKNDFSKSTKSPNNLQVLQDYINEAYNMGDSQIQVDLNQKLPSVSKVNGESRFSRWCRSTVDVNGQCQSPTIPSFYQAFIEFYQDDHYSDKLEGTLFESAINVAPRRFDKGFSLSDGSLLKNPNNNNATLIEYFNVNFKTDIKLLNESEEGWYDFAFLRDDGAVLSIYEMDTKGNVLKEFDRYIFSPQIDPPHFACRSTDSDLIYLKKDKIYRVIVNYFQGPRTHITLQLFWRKVLENTKSLSSHCMTQAVDRNFCIVNPTDGNCAKNSAGEPKLVVNYENFLKQGWEVIPSQFLNLPGSMIDQCKYEDIEELLLQNKPEGQVSISIKKVVNGVEEISEYAGKIVVQDKKLLLDPAITTEIDKVITVKYKHK